MKSDPFETQPAHPTGIASVGMPVHVDVSMYELVDGKLRQSAETRGITINPGENPRLIRRIDVRLGGHIIASVPMAIDEGYWMYVPPPTIEDDDL